MMEKYDSSVTECKIINNIIKGKNNKSKPVSHFIYLWESSHIVCTFLLEHPLKFVSIQIIFWIYVTPNSFCDMEG